MALPGALQQAAWERREALLTWGFGGEEGLPEAWLPQR